MESEVTTPLEWFKSYFTYLKSIYQRVRCNGVLSGCRLISYGVPQGSNLGPLLFILYINNLTNVSQILKLVLFADDATIFLEHNSLAELDNQANCQLAKLAEWFKANKLSLNVSKTCYMSFTASKKKKAGTGFRLFIADSAITRVDTAKFLGVYMDETLTWTNHMNKIAKNKGVIRISHVISLKLRLNLYHTMASPNMSYGNIVWASNYESRMHCFTILRKRIIGGDSYYAQRRRLVINIGGQKFESQISLNVWGKHLGKIYKNILLFSKISDDLFLVIDNFFKTISQFTPFSLYISFFVSVSSAFF